MFQKLVGMHDVDVARLLGELVGKVKTRTWPGTAIDRRDIESLPDDFPRFKGTVMEGVLRVECLRLTENATFTASARLTRLTIPRPTLPESVVGAMAGRRLADVIDHPAIDAVTTVTGVRDVRSADGLWTIVLDLDMHRVPLHETGEPVMPRMRHRAPDLNALASRTHVAIPGAPRMPADALGDPRTWRGVIDRDWSMIGLANETSSTDGAPVLAVRFPYDRRMAATFGRAGTGAWFDRTTYSWRVDPGPDQLERLSSFLARHAEIVIGPDGTLYA